MGVLSLAALAVLVLAALLSSGPTEVRGVPVPAAAPAAGPALALAAAPAAAPRSLSRLKELLRSRLLSLRSRDRQARGHVELEKLWRRPASSKLGPPPPPLP